MNTDRIMKIDKSTVVKIAELSRLELDEHAAEEMVVDLNRMLGFVEKLQEVNTDGVEPLIFMTDETNVYRADIVKDEVSQKDALSNAPKKDMYYFRVPKVIGNSD